MHINSKYVETKHCTWGHSQSMDIHFTTHMQENMRNLPFLWQTPPSSSRVDFGKNESCHDDIQHQCFDLISSVTKGEGFLWISTIYIMDWPLLQSMPILSSSSSSSSYWLFWDKIQPCQINARSFCVLHTNYFLIRLLSVRQNLLLW